MHLTRLEKDFGGTVEKPIHDNPFSDEKGVVEEEVESDEEVKKMNISTTEEIVKDTENYYDLMSLIEAKAVNVEALKMLLTLYKSKQRPDLGGWEKKIQEALMHSNVDLEHKSKSAIDLEDESAL